MVWKNWFSNHASFFIPEKKFSFLNPDEIAKMKEEEEKRIAQMTHIEFSKMTESAHHEADSWTESALEDVAQMDMMARGEPVPKKSLDSSGPHSIPYTAKGERLLRERLERENAELPEELENFDHLSPDEKKQVEAERRAAWRKARLKSLENVSLYERGAKRDKMKSYILFNFWGIFFQLLFVRFDHFCFLFLCVHFESW